MNPIITIGVSTEKQLSDYVDYGLKEIVEIKRDGRLWVSQVSVCPRQGALAATRIGDGIDSAAKKFYCEFGNTAEALILQGWYNSEILLFSDYALPDIGINLGGKVDAIINYNGKITVAEVKTCGNTMPSRAKPAHQAQAALYAAITGLPYVVFYLSRNVAEWNGNLKAKEFNFEFNKDDLKINMFNAIYARLCVDKLVMPNKYIEKKDERCGFCNFDGVCWSNEIPHLSIASSDEQLELVKLANKKTNILMRQSNINKRRNGVLKHLSLHGNDNAVKLLKDKSWSEFI
jgi:hypothetical protein